jgi:ATP-dependent DNA helicase DinG
MEREDAVFKAVPATLRRAIQLATGDSEAGPRPGQVELATAIFETMANNVAPESPFNLPDQHLPDQSRGSRHMAAEAPTGSGKSFAAGVPAMLRAVLHGERTAISTETLGLQSQLIDKDLPIVARAVADVTGRKPTFAVLKGWSNYVCPAAAVEAAARTLQVDRGDATPEGIAALLEQLDDLGGTEDAGGHALLRWALASVVNDTSGDRATFRGECSADDWQRVSVSTAECIGVADCPFGGVCRPAAARERAQSADVVVTNHAMIGVQAVTTAPVVIGSKRLGPIDHLVIDEAHGLPNVVRNQGATNIGAVTLLNILRAVERAADIHGHQNSLRLNCYAVGIALDAHLAKMIAKRSPASAADIEKTDGWSDVLTEVKSWLQHGKAIVLGLKSTPVMTEIRSRRSAVSRIEEMIDMLNDVENAPKEFARWVAAEPVPSKVPQAFANLTGATLHISPVDVGPMLRASVYSGGRAAAEPGEHTHRYDTESAQRHRPPSVVLLSATLPQTVVVTAGLQVQRQVYPSPFADAYERSLLFVPKATRDDLDQIAPRTEDTGRRQFSLRAHAAWAVDHIVTLVAANQGSALVLSATTTAGRNYADQLRARLGEGITVHSQWDGGSVRQAVDLWREDTGSVLVGTRSLMTGVDAPGGTCTLVIIDRVPRAAGNPVDDARMENLMDRLEINRWQAERMVYIADAALLMEQAAGRLIRSVNDSGVVAVLDPRLLRTPPIQYADPNRKALLAALDRFPHRVSSLERVLAAMRAQRAGTTAA